MNFECLSGEVGGDLVTGRGATVYGWRSSRHTWLRTHWRRKCVSQLCLRGHREADMCPNKKVKESNSYINIFICCLGKDTADKLLKRLYALALKNGSINYRTEWLKSERMWANMHVCGVCVSCSSSSEMLIKLHHSHFHSQLAVVTQDVCVCFSQTPRWLQSDSASYQLRWNPCSENESWKLWLLLQARQLSFCSSGGLHLWKLEQIFQETALFPLAFTSTHPW